MSCDCDGGCDCKDRIARLEKALEASLQETVDLHNEINGLRARIVDLRKVAYVLASEGIQ